MSMLDYYRQHQLELYFPESVLEQCQLKSYQKGSSIITMGQTIDGLYCLVKGRTKTVFTTETGRQLLLSFQDPFKMFGDLELFDEKPEAINTIEAVSYCECIFIPMEIIIKELAENPPFLKQLAMSLGKKLGRVIRNSALNTLNPVEVRLASYLLAIFEMSPMTAVPLNLSAIADQLGTSFRHIHRTMQKLIDSDVVEKQSGLYSVLDMNALKTLASSAYIFS